MPDTFKYEVVGPTGATQVVESPTPLGDDELDEVAAPPMTAGQMGGSVARGAMQNLEQGAGFLGRVLRYSNLPGGKEFGAVQSFVQQTREKYVPRREGAGYADDLLEGVGQLGATAGVSLAGGAFAKVLGFGTQAAMRLAQGTGLASMFPAEAEDAAQAELARQKEAGEPPSEGAAIVKGVGYGAVSSLIENRLGVGRLFRQFEKAFGADVASKTLKQVATKIAATVPGNVVSGFTEEALQRVAQDLIVSQQVDVPAAVYEGLVGAPLEAFGGAVATAAGSLKGGDKNAQEVQRREEAVAPAQRPGEEPFAVLSGPRLLRDQKQSGFSPQAVVDGTQMMGRLRNKLTPGEMGAYEEAGLSSFLAEGKKTPEQVAKWMEEKGPQVEVEVWGTTPLNKVEEERNQLKHELDTIRPGWDSLDFPEFEKEPEEVRRRFNRIQELESLAEMDYDIGEQTYQSIAPSKTPVKILGVRVPTSIKETSQHNSFGGSTVIDRVPKEETLYRGSHFGSKDVNLLGFGRYQVETLPSGEKVMHVIEVQSDWDAARRKTIERANLTEGQLAEAYRNPEQSTAGHLLLRDYNRLVLKALIEQARKEGVERVVVSDAETAMMTEGHDAVASMVKPIGLENVARLAKASEAFGADWREGRYLQVLGSNNAAGIYRVDKPEANNPNFVNPAVAKELADNYKEGYIYGKPPQEPGMRLNYGKEFFITDRSGKRLAPEYFPDAASAESFAQNRTAGLSLREGEYMLQRGTLHQLMKELTKQEGERVTVGEHQRALERGDVGGALQRHAMPRSNLIFQEGGKPKTTSTGLAYKLPPRTKPFALFGKGLAPAQQSWTAARSAGTQHARETLAMFNLKDGAKVSDVLSALHLNVLNDPALRELARFLDRHFKGLLNGKVVSETGLGLYYYKGNIHLGDEWLDYPHSLIAEKLLHEVAHAATVEGLLRPITEEQRQAAGYIRQGWRKAEASLTQEERVNLANMRSFYAEYVAKPDMTLAEEEAIRKKWGLDGLTQQESAKLYLMVDETEFVAGIFESESFRTWLDGIKMGDSTLLQKMLDWIYKVLGVVRDSVLGHTLQGVIEMGEALGKVDVKAPAVTEAEQVAPALRPLNFRTNDIYPDSDPIATSNAQTAKLFGAEKVARWLADLGKEVGHPLLTEWIAHLQGGGARINTPAHVALATYAREANGTAKAFANLWGERLANRVNKVLGASPNGDLTKVKPRTRGMSLKTSDVIGTLRVDPKAYKLTAEQWAIVKVLHAIHDRVAEIATSKTYKFLNKKTLKPAHFYRIPLKVPDVLKRSGGTSVGSKPGMFHEQFFKTEQEGWAAGIEYETDIEKLVTTSLENLGRAIAAHRLAHNPLLKWQTPKMLERQMLREAARRKGSPLTAAETKEEKKKAALHADKMRVFGVKSFQGRLFDPEIAQMINKEFEQEISRLRKWLINANSFAKGLQFGIDFGVGQIQLFPTFFSHPLLWMKSQAFAMGAFASPNVFSNYLEQPQNLKAAKQVAAYGHVVGSPLDHLSGLTKGQWLTEMRFLEQVPLARHLRALRHIPRAFGRHFQTALDVAYLEMWKAKSPYVPKSQWPSLVRSIESQLLMGRMESGNLTHSRAMYERLLGLAPSYYRGAIDFVARLASEKGSVGKDAWKSVGSYILGSIALYWAYGLLMGMDEDELEKRLNPEAPEFMLWQMEDGEQKLNFGIGGFFRSIIRLHGELWKAAKEHGADTRFWASNDNPALRWYRGHSAPMVGWLWSFIKGEDYMGKEMAGFGPGIAQFKPVAFQGKTTKERLTGAAGLTAFPEGVRKFEAKQVEREAGKPVGELTYAERMQASVAVRPRVQKYEEFQSEDAKKRGAIFAVEKALERAEKVREELPKDVRQWAAQQKVEIPGYSTSFHRSGVNMPLAQKEYGDLHKAMLAGYERMLRMLMQDADFPKQERETRQKRVSIMLEAARKQVRGEFLGQLGSKAHE